MPADRFFRAAPEVLRVLKDRATANALELARNGLPRKPFYLTGSAGGRLFSVHTEGERVILKRGESGREEIDLTADAQSQEAPVPEGEELPLPLCPTAPLGNEEEHEPVPEPGVSALDAVFGLGERQRPGPDVRDDPAQDGECGGGGREEGGRDDAEPSRI